MKGLRFFKFIVISLATSAVFFIASLVTVADNKPPDTTPVNDNTTLVAVFPTHFPPLYRVSENSLASGFGIDVMEALAEQAQLRIQYQHKPNWTEAMKALANGEADLIPNIGVTPERAALFDFSDPLESIPIVIFTRANFRDIASWEDVIRGNLMVGVVRTNAAVRFVKSTSVKNYTVFPDTETALHELLNQGVDVVLYPQAMMEKLIHKLGMENSIQIVGKPVMNIQRAVAVRKGNRVLLARLNNAIKVLLRSPQYRDIYGRWFPPPPSFWNWARVWKLVGALLALTLFIGFIARLHTLRVVNRRLIAVNTFNSAVLNSAMEGIITVDENATLISANRAAEVMFEVTETELVGRNIQAIFLHHEEPRFFRMLSGNVMQHPGATKDADHYFESVAVRKSGEQFPVRVGVALTKISGKPRLVCTIQDLMEQRRAEHQLAYLSDHDSLTGMLNPNGIKLVLCNLLNQARLQDKPLACISIGITRFRYINDVYSRGAGEAVLAQVAEYLRQTLRASDAVGYIHDQMVARFGDDRFVLLLPDTDREGSRVLVERLLDGISRTTVQYGSEIIHIEAKAGIACYPQHGDNEDELLSRAESALHNALESSVSKILSFDFERMEQTSRIERSLDRVRSALVQDRVLLHFQPIHHIATDKIAHYEVLLRLQDEDGQIIMPDEFIPVAEHYGMIGQIDYRVLQVAFSFLAGMQDSHPGTALAINLSAVHIGDDRLFDWLKQVFNEGVVYPQNVIFEVTETAALKNLSHAKEFMQKLWALGCRFALDDFGVGFTSFAQLRELPVDFVKIDGMFVRNVLNSKEDQALVRAIIDIAHSLDKPVVAECIETEAVMQWLGQQGVDYAQGYWIGRPQAELLPHDFKRQESRNFSHQGNV